jgi:hypothetical protein
MNRSPTTPANLFLAAKSYMWTMKLLVPQIEADSEAALVPFYFLGGFAIELALKSVVLQETGDQKLLRNIGHDLLFAYSQAQKVGYEPNDKAEFEQVLSEMAPVHGGLTFRYIPDLEAVPIPRPAMTIRVISDHVMEIEEKFDPFAAAL